MLQWVDKGPGDFRTYWKHAQFRDGEGSGEVSVMVPALTGGEHRIHIRIDLAMSSGQRRTVRGSVQHLGGAESLTVKLERALAHGGWEIKSAKQRAGDIACFLKRESEALNEALRAAGDRFISF